MTKWTTAEIKDTIRAFRFARTHIAAERYHFLCVALRSHCGAGTRHAIRIVERSIGPYLSFEGWAAANGTPYSRDSEARQARLLFIDECIRLLQAKLKEKK